jgi:NDP-sugar pyrophosphorylase family protein
MPTLIQLAIKDGGRVSPFLIHEYWRDIGKPDDFHSANAEYGVYFGGL